MLLTLDMPNNEESGEKVLGSISTSFDLSISGV
jgi:hypothetical protein